MKPAHSMLSTRKLAELADIGYFNCRWYDNALAEIKLVCELEQWPIDRTVAILAITSPRVSVRRNIRIALQYLHDSRYLANVLPTIKRAVANYETTGIIGGHKVPQFARALLGDKQAIVLDSWMAKALFATDDSNAIKQFRRQATMRVACERITQAGERVGLSPRDCQACIWQAIIEIHKATPASYSVLREYKLWLEFNRQFPASGAIDASEVIGERDSEF